MPKLEVQQGTTSYLIEVFVQNSSSTTGAGLTGLAYNTGSLTAYYYISGASGDVAISLASMTLGTWTSGGFVAIDGTNMGGMYQIGLPNACFASLGSVKVMLQGASNMAPVVLEIQVVAFNPNDGTRLGLTALPNASAAASGGLITIGTGSGQITPDGSGNVPIALGQSIPSSPTANTVGEALYMADSLRGRINTAQAGTSTTITLDSGASSSAGSYVGDGIWLYGGTGGGLPGAGQYRTIVAYNTSTKVATVNRAWDTTPDSTSKFMTLPQVKADTWIWQGTEVSTPATAGIPDVNAKNVNNVSTSSVTTIDAVLGTTYAITFDGNDLPIVDVGDWDGHAVTVDSNNAPNVSAKYWAGTAITASSIPVGTTAGANGGLFISGTNTGALVVNGGVQFISNNGDAFLCESTGGNGNGINATGNGTGNGYFGQGGNSNNGDGMHLVGGSDVSVGLRTLGGSGGGAGTLMEATASGSNGLEIGGDGAADIALVGTGVFEADLYGRVLGNTGVSSDSFAGVGVETNVLELDGQTVSASGTVTFKSYVGASGQPGAANGVFIAGNNAATTITGTNASGGTGATAGLTLIGGNADTSMGGVAASGLSSLGGSGAASTNGAAAGGYFQAGTTTTVSGNNGFTIIGTGTGHGIQGLSGYGGATGDGANFTSQATNGNGMTLTHTGTGVDFNADTNNLTIATVTNLTNLPSIPNNWLTAAGINSGALNGKGDWLVSSSYPSNFGDLTINSNGGVNVFKYYDAGQSAYEAYPNNFYQLAITSGGIAKADLQTIKTQTVTCGAAVTINPQIGSAYELDVDSSGAVPFNNSGVATAANQATIISGISALGSPQQAGQAVTLPSTAPSWYSTDVNIASINGTTVTGNGSSGNPWGPA